MPFSLFMASTPRYAGTANPPSQRKAGFFGAVSSLLGGNQSPSYQSAPAVSTTPADACVRRPTACGSRRGGAAKPGTNCRDPRY